MNGTKDTSSKEAMTQPAVSAKGRGKLFLQLRNDIAKKKISTQRIGGCAKQAIHEKRPLRDTPIKTGLALGRKTITQWKAAGIQQKGKGNLFFQTSTHFQLGGH